MACGREFQGVEESPIPGGTAEVVAGLALKTAAGHHSRYLAAVALWVLRNSALPEAVERGTCETACQIYLGCLG